jgi:RHS repeat-associated protein
VTLPANVTGGTSTVYNADNAQTNFNGTALNYDSNGNLTNDGTNTYTWDARNHLTAISGGSAATFTYDGFGRRAKKVIGGTTTQFLYDGLNPVQELNGRHNAAVIANLLTGLGIDEYLTRTDISTGVTSTLLTDALGSTIGLITSNNGPIATNYTYQPFGATTIGGSANGNSYEFTGRENDGTGLYFYRARYYSPTLQRFIAQDPIGFSGGDANVYAYVGNNPLILLDPTGQGWLDVPGYLWNSPNTVIGLAYGGVQIPFGARPKLGPNGIEFQNVPLQNLFGRDVTLGNVSCFGSPNQLLAPDQQSFGQARGVTNEQHETAHTYQGEIIGPFYLPAYAVGMAIGQISTGDWHNNFMESGPMSNPPRAFK